MSLETEFCIAPQTVKRNLWFYSTKELGDFSRSDRPEDWRIACVTELFCREFLCRGSAEREISGVLSHDVIRDFRRQITKDFLDVCKKRELLEEQELWYGADSFSQRCATSVRGALIDLCEESDGFIPVYLQNNQHPSCDGNAFFIPFHFVEGDNVIVDLCGAKINGWQSSYQRIFPPEFRFSCVVHCDQSRIPELRENSFMFPLYLAYLRKTGRIQYNHLRLLATGVIDRDRLVPVRVEEKVAALRRCFADAYFFFPINSQYCPSGREVPISCWRLAEISEKMPGYIDAKGLIVPSFTDALKRLDDIAEECKGTYRQWTFMLQQLENNEEAIPAYRSPENYLKCLMLKSSILCHMGKTDEALAWNREAQSFAERNGSIPELRRLEIEELVELQDKELFDDILLISKGLQKDIEKLDDNDLRMRYFGTVGQAHCCGVLAGHLGFDREYARQCFDLALKNACLLKEENHIGSEGDIAQDLNYRFMWYALFEPESTEALIKYQDADNHIRHNLGGKIQQKNRRFLHRLKAFSVYRLWLRDGVVPDEIPEMLRSEYAGDWVAALTGKYVGALTAATGCAEEAAEIFRDCVGILSQTGEPILRFIQMTILAEAYRSTGLSKYRDEALVLLESLRNAYPDSIEAWRKFLLVQKDFPGWNYWY